MKLTKRQFEELDALVNFFGGEDHIMKFYWRDRTYRSLIRRGLITWRKPKKPWGEPFRCITATDAGRAALNEAKEG